MDLRIKKSREKPLTLINRSMMKQRTRHETDPRNFSKVIVPFEIDKKEKVTIIIAIIFFGKFEIRGRTSIARRINRFFFLSSEKRWGDLMEDGGRSWRSAPIGSCSFHVENRSACCNCSFDRWPRRETWGEGGSLHYHDRRDSRSTKTGKPTHPVSHPRFISPF